MPTLIPTGQVTTQNVVTGLDTIWSIEFQASTGHMFFTERPGRLNVWDGFTKTLVVNIAGTESVNAEEGLQGLALDPDFDVNNFIYVYYSFNSSGIKNRVVRYTYNPSTKTAGSPLTLIDNIPGFQYHVGGRIRFGPDGKLYIAVGDGADNGTTDSIVAQDNNSLQGKILRINKDGTIPSDNPIPGNRLWSKGHRNPQGLAWDPAGRMWATEHGPTSTSTLPQDHDELNLITAGSNYGWPYVYGDTDNPLFTTPGGFTYVSPTYQSGDATWAPGGTEYYTGDVYGSTWKNSILITGLGIEGRSSGGFIDGRALYRLNMSGATPGTFTRFFYNTLGRLRAVTQGPDGYIYMSTSNRDGRGPASPAASDDRIMKLMPVTTTLATPTNISASANALVVTVNASAANTDALRSGIAIFRKTSAWTANDDPSLGTQVAYQAGTTNTNVTVTETLPAGTYYYAAFTVHQTNNYYSSPVTAPALTISATTPPPSTTGWIRRNASPYTVSVVIKAKSITATGSGSTVNITLIEPIDSAQSISGQSFGRASAKLYRKNSPWTTADTTGATLVRTFEGI